MKDIVGLKLQSCEHNDVKPIMMDCPYFRFIYALKAPKPKRQYPKCLEVFLNYLKLQGLTIEERSNKYTTQSRKTLGCCKTPYYDIS